MNHKPVWMEDPLVKDIPEEKLDFLEEIYRSAQGKTQKELIAYMIPALKRAQSKNLTLNPQEINLAITAIKKHSTKEELDKIDALLKKAQK